MHAAKKKPMPHTTDLSFLDKPEYLRRIFPLALNAAFLETAQSDSLGDAYFLDVAEDVRLCCKFYTDNAGSPSILFFTAAWKPP